MELQPKILSIREAVHLYTLIKEYIPEEYGSDVLSFTGKILDELIDNEGFEVYQQILSLLSGLSAEELIRLSPDDVLSLFINGLADNKILLLQSFLEKAEFGHG